MDVEAARGRADSGDLELDLIELFTDVASLAGDLGVGIALFVDEMQDIPAHELAALCGACHEISQQGAPLIVVGAGPAAPARGARRLQVVRRAAVPLRRRSTGSPARWPSGRGCCPRRARTRRTTARRSTSSTASPTATPTSCRPTARSPGTSRSTPRSPGPTSMQAAPEAEAELAVGFFGARYDRATPAERDYMVAMADLGEGTDDLAVSTADVARLLAPQAAVALPRPRRPDQEGPGLLRRARHRRLHRPPLRQVPAQPALRARVGGRVTGFRRRSPGRPAQPTSGRRAMLAEQRSRRPAQRDDGSQAMPDRPHPVVGSRHVLLGRPRRAGAGPAVPEVEGRDAAAVAEAVRRVGPIQSQTARSPFLGLAARLPGVTHGDGQPRRTTTSWSSAAATSAAPCTPRPPRTTRCSRSATRLGQRTLCGAHPRARAP